MNCSNVVYSEEGEKESTTWKVTVHDLLHPDHLNLRVPLLLTLRLVDDVLPELPTTAGLKATSASKPALGLVELHKKVDRCDAGL